jgi:HlyD family secretion protein
LRVKEGQKVKRDEIIAVLSNYPKAEEALRKAEANLTRLKQQHDTVLMGTRVTNIALQEATLKSSIESDKLQTVQRARSGKPPEEKELEVRLAEQRLEREKVGLALAKQVLKNDLAQYEIDLANTQAQIELAAATARHRWSARHLTVSWCRLLRARASVSQAQASPRSSI